MSDIADDGVIAISDEGHFKLYAADGQWLRNVEPPYGREWGISPRFLGGNLVLPTNRLFFVSRQGDLVNEVASYRSDFIGEVDEQLYLAQRDPKQWRVYSSSGELLDIFKEKPLALGRIEENIFGYQNQKLHRVTVSFPDQEWKIISEHGACGEYDYRVDSDGYLYCLGSQGVTRYSQCGKPVAQFGLPEDVITQKPSGMPGVEDFYTIVELYSGLEMADNGDLYASKITQDNYSVVKWVWEDSADDPIGGPDAPVGLNAVAGESEVKLSWTHSLQDPGCVTGYEIGRATTAGGPYTVLTTVEAGPQPLEYEPYTHADSTAQAGTTYYYAVRAVSAIGKSDYSNEASAGL